MSPALHLLVPLFGGLASAVNLYATHYSGSLNLLNFNGNSLTLTSSTSIGNRLPSWITYDGPGKALYIPDENFYGGPGTLVSFSIAANGAVTKSGSVSSDPGVVASTIYGGAEGRSFFAQVHYEQSQMTTFKLPLNNAKVQQTLKYSGKGPASRQGAPHPHHAFVDPTGDFLLVTDLGIDAIHIYKIDKTSGQLQACADVKSPSGFGPRHGAFWVPKSSRVKRGAAVDGTMLFVANELANSVSGYSVSYASGGCLSLSLKQSLSPYQGNTAAPRGTKVGEIRVKDNFLYTSNRNDKKFSPNDSITQYTISSTGSITWTDITSSYGTYPRTFDINKAGDYVAIGDQTTSNVAIVKRDPTTGKLTGQAASLRIGSAGTAENEDGLSAVVWAE